MSSQRPLHPDHFVAYADVLGFRQLVLDHETPHAENLETRRRLGTANFDRLFTLHSPVGERFKAFHAAIEQATNGVPWMNQASILVFSDSIFVATRNWQDCTWFCETLMQHCIRGQVPLRIGIGYGSFVTHGLSSDMTTDLRIINTQFLGKGVIYATDAEKSLKGMRIALHPTAVVPLKKLEVHPDKFLELPDNQRSGHASHEWNYLTHAYQMADYPELAESDQQWELRVRLEHMQKEAPEDLQVQIHYKEGLAAFDRMVEAIESWHAGM